MPGYWSPDFNVIVWQKLPVRLRQAVQYAWLKVLVSPVVYLYNLFKINRDTNIYGLGINSQVCYLEKVLNDTFDLTPRRIFITDGEYHDPLAVYLVPETKPVWLGLVSEEGGTTYPDPEPLYLDSESYSISGVQFIVHVPTAVYAGHENRLKAVVNKDRLVGKKNWIVVTF